MRGEMERAYRRRENFVYWISILAAIGTLAVAHNAKDPWFYPMIALLFAEAGLILSGPSRLFFPHAWRMFDAPRPSPELEGEARGLARSMGIRLVAFRVVPSRSVYPKVRWRGQTMFVRSALCDLSPEARRYALARALAAEPDLTTRFVAFAAQPLAYATWAAWCFDYRHVALALGMVVALWLLYALVRTPGRDDRAKSEAKKIVGDEAALAYWRHMEALSPFEAKRELQNLLTPASPERVTP